MRNSFRYAARQDWDKVAKALKPVYTSPCEDTATQRFGAFQEAWGRKYPAIIKLRENAWAEFVPFLSFDVEIRKVICSTNAIKSVNARIRKSVRARGHFPNEAAALKCVYMALMSLNPTDKGRKTWTIRWKAPLNAFQVAFEDRLTNPVQYPHLSVSTVYREIERNSKPDGRYQPWWAHNQALLRRERVKARRSVPTSRCAPSYEKNSPRSVVIDIFSRYIVGHTVERAESAVRAEELIRGTTARNGIVPRPFTRTAAPR